MAYLRQNQWGLWTLAIASCSVSDLAHLLDPAVPLVFLSNYQPGGAVRWWDVPLPLARGEPARTLRVRSLCFEVEMTTAEFLQRLPSIGHANGGGLDLLQLTRSLPARLGHEFDRTDELIAAGMTARFTLPHGGEVGVFATRSRSVLERALEVDELRRRCIGDS